MPVFADVDQSGLVLRTVLVGACAVSFLFYGRAIARDFSRPTGIALQMRLIQVAGSAFALLQLWLLATADLSGTLGIAVALAAYIAGLAIFWQAREVTRARPLSLAFSSDQPAHLLDSGVYRYVRHPFYLAYTLTWIAGATAVPEPLAWAAPAAMWSLYLYAARVEERKFDASPLATAYRAYRSRAGMFLPKLPR